jgi:hypothetical protein
MSSTSYDPYSDRFLIPMDRGSVMWCPRGKVERLYEAAEKRGDERRAVELLELLTRPERYQ